MRLTAALAPAAALLAGVLVLCVACGSGDAGTGDRTPDSAEDLVVADIGGVTVSLDAGGQDAGEPIAIEAIAIEAIEGETAPSEGGEPVAAFRLLPDGATFAEPVRLTIELSGRPQGPLMGMHFSEGGDGGDGIELLDLGDASYDADTDSTSYTIELTHFSEVHVRTYGEVLEARLLPPLPAETYQVGESFVVRARVAPDEIPGWDYRRSGTRQQVHVAAVNGAPLGVTTHWRSTGGVRGIDFADIASLEFVFKSSDYDPTPLAPEQTQTVFREAQPGSTLDFEQRFTCEREGRFFVFFHGRSSQAAIATVFEGGTVVERVEDDVTSRVTLGITGVCGAESSASPTTVADPRTATPTATPTPRVLAPVAPGAPAVRLPFEPADPTPVVPGKLLEGFILVYAYDGVWYDGSAMVFTPAHEPFCSYEHLHGGTTASILPGPDGKPIFISEMHGECGYGPSNALFWIKDPR